MIVYILVMLTAITLYFISVYGRSRASKIFSIMSFTLLWLFSGLRGDVGQDTLNYMGHFNALDGIESVVWYFKNIEPIFALLVVFSRFILNDVTLMFLIISFIQTLLLWKILTKLNHPILFLICYLFIFYIEFHFNVLRGGLAFLLFVYGYLSEKKIKSLIFLGLASLTHISVIILIPFYLIRNKKYLNLFHIIVSALIILLLYVLLQDTINNKISVYFYSTDLDIQVPKVMSVIAMLGCVFLFWQRYISKEILFAYLILCLTWYFNTGVDIFLRISLMILGIYFILVCNQRLLTLKLLKITPLLFFSSFLMAWFAFGTLSSLPYEKQKIIRVSKGNVDFTILPYELYFQSEYR